MDSLFEMLEETKQINARSKMESGLLSTFHDDHFDGNYSKYDNLGVWSDRNDGMGLQLSETLHGILPITGHEESSHFYETDIQHRVPYRFGSENDGLAETIIEIDKSVDEDYLLTSYDTIDDMCESMSPSIEIISVDPNCEFSSPISIEDDDDDDDDDENNCDGNEADTAGNQCSDYSSDSSIADYESHSSDESDVEKYEINKLAMKCIKAGSDTQIELDKLIEKSSKQQRADIVTHRPKNIVSSDPQLPSNIVGCNEKDKTLEHDIINMKSFDLATYITQENYDFVEQNVGEMLTDNKSPSKHANNISELSFSTISLGDIKHESKSDSDAEVIVDIETIHDYDEHTKPMLLRKQTVDYSSCLDLNEPLAVCDDDIKHDPSWSPKREKSTKTFKLKGKPQTKNKKTNSLFSQCNRILNTSCPTINLSNKSHVVMDRKKYGLGKGKNISMCTQPEVAESAADSDVASDAEFADSIAKKERDIGFSQENSAIDSNPLRIRISNLNVKPSLPNSTERIPTNIIPKTEIKQEFCKSEIKQEQKTVEIKTEKTEISNEQRSCSEETKIHTQNCVEQMNSEVAHIVPVKKKLNLEEYKRRRENQLIGDTKIKKTLLCDPIPPINNNSAKRIETKNTTETPRTNFSLLLNKTQSNQTYFKQGKQFYDPILEAKNKVLRMQELKKAAISKRIDSTVSSKVGPITPILPLEQICGGFKTQKDYANKLNAEYEEIIIVSASCNTEITMPPVFEKLNAMNTNQKNYPLTAVMNSSSLLSNINNNNNIKQTNCVRISSNSLLSSIQDVVLKQSATNLLNGNPLTQKSPNIGVSPPSQFSPQKPEMSHTEEAIAASTNCNKTGNSKQTEHGEDKIIMHLRKDRIRKRTFSVSMQTDDLPQFPPLTVLLAEKQASNSCSNPKKRKRHYRSRRQLSGSSSVENDGYRSSSRSHVRYYSISSHEANRSVSPRSSRYSYSSGRRTASPYHKVRRRSDKSGSRIKYASDSSTDSSHSGRTSRSRGRRTRRYSSSHSSSSSSTSSSASSSRSRSRSARSRSRYSPSESQPSILNYRRNSSPAVEERRIVYVGRIERETSKEDLKRKFSSYGPIKQITVHYKDTGMKYGFVTFEKAQDAYQVIDRSLNDTRINMYDVSFGGRRAFCRQIYSDLDGAATNSLQDLPYSMAPRTTSFKEDSFESLLAKVKEKMSSSKPSASPASSVTSSSRCKT